MTKNNVAEKREPLITITRRDGMPKGRAMLIRGIAILIALFLCGVITMLVTDESPLAIYVAMYEGSFGTANQTWVLFENLAILLCISLAVTPAFRMKFWNTGAQGQVLAGALATAVCMFSLGGKMPEWTLMIVMAVAAVLAGALWGFIPAFFKAHWNTNETLFTLMMNYVAIQFIQYFLKVADKSGSNTVGPDLLSHGWYPALFGQEHLLPILVAVLLTVAMYVYLNFSKQGYEISVVGESENTARYIGINVKKVVIRTMILSGALCGLVGLLLVGVKSHSISPGLESGYGFTAIMVSWLAKFDPITMIFASFLLVFLERGAGEISSTCGINSSFSSILTGVIIFFIIGCEFFIHYRLHLNIHKDDGEKKKEETCHA